MKVWKVRIQLLENGDWQRMAVLLVKCDPGMFYEYRIPRNQADWDIFGGLGILAVS